MPAPRAAMPLRWRCADAAMLALSAFRYAAAAAATPLLMLRHRHFRCFSRRHARRFRAALRVSIERYAR